MSVRLCPHTLFHIMWASCWELLLRSTLTLHVAVKMSSEVNKWHACSFWILHSFSVPISQICWTVALYLIEKETISMGKCCAYLRHQWNGRLDCEASQPPCEARWFKPTNNPKSRLAIPKLFLLHLANLKFLKTLRFQLSSCFGKIDQPPTILWISPQFKNIK